MPDVSPDPKRPEARTRPRRTFRRRASRKEWAALRAEKLDGQGCRLVWEPGEDPGSPYYVTEMHHLVPRSMGGDDVADNLVPLCPRCHELITNNDAHTLKRLAWHLTDAEYAYCVGKLGEGAMGRLFGV